MRTAGKLWRELVDQKQVELRIHPFWTTHYSFTELRAAAPDIFSDLAEADIVIFKGDLNYRKLTEDGLWPRTTSFETALGDYPSPPVSVSCFVLRTCCLCGACARASRRAGQEDQGNVDPDWVVRGDQLLGCDKIDFAWLGKCITWNMLPDATSKAGVCGVCIPWTKDSTR
jgi:hypothetical protein